MHTKAVVVNKIHQAFALGNKTIPILKGISLSAQSQEFLSIVGPSGSGKSTLLNCMSGLTQPTAGQVLINNVNPYQLSPSKLAQMRRQEIGFIFQSYNLVPALPVFENIVLPLRLSGEKIQRKTVQNLLEKMNFAADLNSFVTNLSGGEKQKVAIARVLLTHSKIIFADEPTGAVDSISKEIIFTLLRKLADDGACVVMVTHDIELAMRTDRTIILKDGLIQENLIKPTASQLLTTMEE